MTCADFPNANEGLPDDESKFAYEGTIAHGVLEACLLLDLDAFDFVGMVTRHPTEGWVFTFEEDDAEHLQPIIDWVREQPGELYPEHRVDLSHWLGPNQFGTLDVGIVAPHLISIGDLKYGRGVPVSPVQNKQLRLYALGFIKKFVPDILDQPDFPVRIVIEQPRHSEGGGTWMTTVGDLLAFGEEARAAAEATRQPNPPRTASLDGCLWCKRRQQPPSEPGAVTGCKTWDQFHLDLLQCEFDDFDDDDLPLADPDAMSPDHRARVHAHKASIPKWLDQIGASLMSEALSTGDAGGLKAVAGKAGRRTWADAKAAEAAATELIAESAFTKRLKTPTQLSKEVSKEDYEKHLAKHVIRADPKPILVPLEDERPALLTADEFDDFDS